jgi:putative transposase
MYQVKDLTQLTVKDLWKEVKRGEEWWGEINREVLSLVKIILESSLDEEILEELQVNRYHRSDRRRGYRNGCYERSLCTRYGIIKTLRVPRTREGFTSTILPRYQRRPSDVDKLIRECFLGGLSTRRVGEVLAPLCGEKISSQTVSNITVKLNSEVAHYHSLFLGDNYQYLLLDGITMKVKSIVGVKKRLILCAYGITPEGKRELISFRQRNSESENQWESFLQNLYQRGLQGNSLKLIVTDGCPGLHQALEIVYPFIPKQRCWAHKLRNVANKLPRKIQETCLIEAKGIYQAQTQREARDRFLHWATHWRELAPKAVTCLETDIDELVNFFNCPKGHWRKIRTTNAIERAFREVRRRTRPMSCFQNSASVDRIIYGVVSYLNNKWKEKPLSQFTQLS